jgi:hypothetical protein
MSTCGDSVLNVNRDREDVKWMRFDKKENSGMSERQGCGVAVREKGAVRCVLKIFFFFLYSSSLYKNVYSDQQITTKTFT